MFNIINMRYLDANTYYKEKFGCKMYKAAVSLDVTCPTRDGTKGIGGCRFCSPMGSGEFASSCRESVTAQIDDAIQRLGSKTDGNTRYIAYFQSFTSTYCDPSYLRSALMEAASHSLVRAISVATRPDCLPDDILGVLREVNRIIPVTVELGFQTSRRETCEWFGRGYGNEVYDKAVADLHAIGVEVVTHVIFGLKGESTEDMLDSVRYVCGRGTDGVKFTCLYVLSGTPLAKEWEAGDIALPTMEEYFDIVDEALKILPPGTVVHRLTGDGPKRLLLAPLWTSNKREVINYIRKRFG